MRKLLQLICEKERLAKIKPKLNYEVPPYNQLYEAEWGRVAVLTSSSKGNCTYVEMEGTKILVDVGITTIQVKKKLAEIGVDIEDIQAILITHEHIDHIRALPVLMKKYKIPVWSREGTIDAIKEKIDESLHGQLKIMTDSSKQLVVGFAGDLTFYGISTSHDAESPCGYFIQSGSHAAQVSVFTDLGFVTKEIQDALDISEAIVLEANYDPNMLDECSYAQELKDRIVSNTGHLCNKVAGNILTELGNTKKRTVFLAHISHEANSPEVCYNTIMEILKANGKLDNFDIRLTK